MYPFAVAGILSICLLNWFEAGTSETIPTQSVHEIVEKVEPEQISEIISEPKEDIELEELEPNSIKDEEVEEIKSEEQESTPTKDEDQFTEVKPNSTEPTEQEEKIGEVYIVSFKSTENGVKNYFLKFVSLSVHSIYV